MRSTTVLRRLLGITSLVVKSFRFADDNSVEVEVKPRARLARCGECDQRAPGYDLGRTRRWRHLSFGRRKVYLKYRPRRVECPHHGIRTESVPWAAHGSSFTYALEELVAHLARGTDKTTVSRLTGVTWRAVGSIVRRVVAERLDAHRMNDLRRIGVDEFSYRKRHNYLTIVVDHDTGHVVWAAQGRSAATLAQFFDRVGEERAAQIKCATIDMSAGYAKAIRERAPAARIIYDRFHVQKLVSEALDEVRRSLLRKLRGTPQGRAIFESRFALLKKPSGLHDSERRKLRDIERFNKPLWRAYLLKEALADVFRSRHPGRGRWRLSEWLAWACRSRLAPFVKVARTIRKHFDGIMAYFDERLTNGLAEGTNNHLRVIARRAFGFHSPSALISMLYLCRGGVELDPPIPA